jgi:large subunit ribosomal protein L30
MARKIKVTYVKSIIHGTQRQRECIRSLGLRKIRQARILDDSPAVRGLAEAVPHLVKLEEIES